jgi:hypothetical protein
MHSEQYAVIALANLSMSSLLPLGTPKAVQAEAKSSILHQGAEAKTRIIEDGFVQVVVSGVNASIRVIPDHRPT